MSKSPQLENGYTTISNELVDQFCRLHLSPNDWNVLWCVINKTWRWHKKSDKISFTQFEKETSLIRPRVAEAIKELVRINVLSVDKTGYINSYQIQKDYSKWETSTEISTSTLVR